MIDICTHANIPRLSAVLLRRMTGGNFSGPHAKIPFEAFPDHLLLHKIQQSALQH